MCANRGTCSTFEERNTDLFSSYLARNLISYLVKMSNKDFLKLDNEFRNDLPKYKAKPEIGSIEKPDFLKKRVSDFLTKARDTRPESSNQQNENNGKKDGDNRMDVDRGRGNAKQVEMDIYLTPIQQ